MDTWQINQQQLPSFKQNKLNLLLQKEDLSIEDFLSDEPLLTSQGYFANCINTELNDFLLKNIGKLIDLITTRPNEDADDARCYQFPFLAQKILTSGNGRLVSSMLNSDDDYEYMY